MKLDENFEQAFKLISAWIEQLSRYPGFHEWKLSSIGQTLTYGDPWNKDPDARPSEFRFPAIIENRHKALSAFFGLHTTLSALADTEYYFRRYPFHDLPVRKEDHLRYTCENYFSRVYEFSERLKKCLNALNEVNATQINAGAIIKEFGKEFKEEIKARNQIHHHNRFEDVLIERITLEGMMALKPEDVGHRGWKHEQTQTYRKASKEWAKRARRASRRLTIYLSAVSIIIVRHSTWLTEPIIPDETLPLI